ncbi:MAG: M15 family metallopeptidase [Patescibacteria group bacterium]
MQNHQLQLIIASVACLILLGALFFGVYQYMELDTEANALAKAKVESDAYIEELTDKVAMLGAENAQLVSALRYEQAKAGGFERQIQDISGTVGTLAKLAATDPELLAKYSKIYFLNENYVPSALGTIDKEDLSDPAKTLEFHAEALPHLEDLLEEASEDKIEIRVVSAFRSFGTQAALKGNYLVTYGAGANRFSADQGYSEHQLGTTVDLTTPALGSVFTSFAATDAYGWLTENAHRYGFILSYPAGNVHYQYEPWHWRYVGIELATKLHKEGKNFYDLDQREIDTYLVSLFD